MGQGHGAQRGARVRENLATLRLLRLTQALDLTEEQTSRIFPFINKIEKEKIGIQRQMSARYPELRRIIGSRRPGSGDRCPIVEIIRPPRKQVKQLRTPSPRAFLEKHLTGPAGQVCPLPDRFLPAYSSRPWPTLKPQRGAAPALIKK